MKEHEQHGGGRDDPQQSIAVVSAEYGIGGDARRIIVGEPGQHPWPEHSKERGESPNPCSAQARETAGDAPPQVRHGVGWCAGPLAPAMSTHAVGPPAPGFRADRASRQDGRN